MTTLPKSRVIDVYLQVVLPAAATREEIEEWLEAELCSRGGVDAENPLIDEGVEVVGEPTLTDTGLHLHEHVVCTGKEGSYTTFQTTRRLLREPCDGPTAQEQITAMHLARGSSGSAL